MAKKVIMALLTEEESRALEARKRILDGPRKARLVSRNAFKWAEWNIELVNVQQSVFRCKACGATWSPDLLENKKLSPDYWQCPNGCNANAE